MTREERIATALNTMEGIGMSTDAVLSLHKFAGATDDDLFSPVASWLAGLTDERLADVLNGLRRAVKFANKRKRKPKPEGEGGEDQCQSSTIGPESSSCESLLTLNSVPSMPSSDIAAKQSDGNSDTPKRRRNSAAG